MSPKSPAREYFMSALPNWLENGVNYGKHAILQEMKEAPYAGRSTYTF